MTHSEHAPGYVPNPDFSQEDWDEVSDTPELTDAEVAELRSDGEGLPIAFVNAFKRLAVRPKSEAKAVPVSLRVPPDVLAAHKADGPSWHTRMNEALVASGGPGVGAASGVKALQGAKCGGSGPVEGLRQHHLHKAFLRDHDPENWPVRRNALRAMNRADLIGSKPDQLVLAHQSAGTGLGKTEAP